MTQKASLLVERARTLAPLLGQHSEEAERLRRPHDAVIEALEESELFKLMVPRALGGFELDLDTFLEVGLALGEGDASMAWVANFYIEHCWMFCHFPQEFQKTVFGDRGYTLAPASIAPTGRATPVDGGFRLKGRWQWGTGVMHAHWVLLSAIVESPDNALDVRLFALPIADVAVEDVWYVDGMQGTGSNDIVVHDVLVPTDRTTAMADMLVGRSAASKLYPGPLYRTPTAAILALAAAMPSVGQARAAVGCEQYLPLSIHRAPCAAAAASQFPPSRHRRRPLQSPASFQAAARRRSRPCLFHCRMGTQTRSSRRRSALRTRGSARCGSLQCIHRSQGIPGSGGGTSHWSARATPSTCP